jgi:PTH2 family peptidyl-tRNA hydrolase
MEKYPFKQVIVVRTDLNMRKGKIAAQVAHACTNIIYFAEEKEYLRKIEKWMENDYPKIVVGCQSETDLYHLKYDCMKNNIMNWLVHDVGYTEFNNNVTPTCIAIGPDYNSVIDKLCRKYPLI